MERLAFFDFTLAAEWQRGLSLGAVLFWFVFYWQVGRRAVGDIRKSILFGQGRTDSILMVSIGLFSLVVVSTGCLMLAGMVKNSFPDNGVILTGGCLLTLAGIAGMFACRDYLGRFWTAETSLIDSHQVVDGGPYGVVRHPIYSFAVLMYLGLGLVFLTWWNLLAAGIIIAGYVLKTRDEDRFLAEHLPGYAAYKQRTRFRLIPGVW